jgi:hypothetical protein
MNFGPYAAHYLAVNNAAADTQLVAAPGAGKAIRVHGYVLCNDASAATKMSFVSDGTGDTEIASFSTYTAGGPIVAPVTPHGWFQTLENEALDLRQTTTDDIDGHIVYSIVDVG